MPVVREFAGSILPQSRTSEVWEQGLSLPLVPDFGTTALPHTRTVGLTEFGGAGEPNTGTPKGRKS